MKKASQPLNTQHWNAFLTLDIQPQSKLGSVTLESTGKDSRSQPVTPESEWLQLAGSPFVEKPADALCRPLTDVTSGVPAF